LVEFLPELPKTGTDKIDRQALLTGAVKLRRVASIAARSGSPITPPRRRSIGNRGGAA
jgi:hypothetical protein